MRIIKLGKGEFKTLGEVKEFFEGELLQREPKGKFRLRKLSIAEDKLNIGEPILFSYQTIVCFSARTKTGRLINYDKQANKYPYYFVVDMDTLQPSNIRLKIVEERLRDELGGKHLVKTQRWPALTDTPATNELWESLRK